MLNPMTLLKIGKEIDNWKKKLGLADITEVFFGLIFLLCVWNVIMTRVGVEAVALFHTGIFALAAGLAAYKIHLLSALTERLDELEKNNKRLDESTKKLTGQNESFMKNNEELKSTIDSLGSQSGNLTNQIDKLQQTITDLETVRTTMETFAKDNNKDLGNVIDNLSKAITDQKGLLVDQTSILSKTREATKNQERMMLLQLQSQLQFQDQQAGLSRTEYDQFLTLLPDVFQPAIKKHNVTFESLDKNGDGVLDFQEFQVVINKLLDD